MRGWFTEALNLVANKGSGRNSRMNAQKRAEFFCAQTVRMR